MMKARWRVHTSMPLTRQPPTVEKLASRWWRRDNHSLVLLELRLNELAKAMRDGRKIDSGSVRLL